MTPPSSTVERHGFRHEALFYSGPDGFLAGTVPFIREGLDADEPVLVVVDALKIKALRAELDGAADRVLFADMADVGLNPARIIPAWRSFLDDHGGGTRPVRGIGEPIWAGRSPTELVEAQRHETLLNVAFSGSGDWALLCPYDRDTLGADVLEEAERSHPVLVERGARWESARCPDLNTMSAPFEAPLPEPPATAAALTFRGETDLGRVRAFVGRHAELAGLDECRASELVLAVHELTSNSIRYGGGHGELRIWLEGDHIMCEVRDRGRFVNPLAGRERPAPRDLGGRGLWIANQICDLVQLRTYPDGNAVRVHMHPVPKLTTTS